MLIKMSDVKMLCIIKTLGMYKYGNTDFIKWQWCNMAFKYKTIYIKLKTVYVQLAE